MAATVFRLHNTNSETYYVHCKCWLSSTESWDSEFKSSDPDNNRSLNSSWHHYSDCGEDKLQKETQKTWASVSSDPAEFCFAWLAELSLCFFWSRLLRWPRLKWELLLLSAREIHVFEIMAVINQSRILWPVQSISLQLPSCASFFHNEVFCFLKGCWDFFLFLMLLEEYIIKFPLHLYYIRFPFKWIHLDAAELDLLFGSLSHCSMQDVG